MLTLRIRFTPNIRKHETLLNLWISRSPRIILNPLRRCLWRSDNASTMRIPLIWFWSDHLKHHHPLDPHFLFWMLIWMLPWCVETLSPIQMELTNGGVRSRIATLIPHVFPGLQSSQIIARIPQR